MFSNKVFYVAQVLGPKAPGLWAQGPGPKALGPGPKAQGPGPMGPGPKALGPLWDARNANNSGNPPTPRPNPCPGAEINHSGKPLTGMSARGGMATQMEPFVLRIRLTI